MLFNSKFESLNSINNLFRLAVLSAAVFVSSNAAAITLQPDETGVNDAWVQPSLAGAGDDEQLHVWKSSTVGGFKSLYQILNLTSLIPSVSSSAEITSAVLNLYVLDTEGGSHGSHGPGFEGASVPIEVSAMANPWVEANWAGGSPEANALWNDAVTASGGSVTNYDISASGWISLDVTDIVRSWMDYELTDGLDGLADYGFLINAPIEVRASDNAVLTAAFYSSAATDSTLRPSLEVSAVPVPAAIWLMGSGMIGLIGFSRSSTRLSNKKLTNT